MLLTDFKLLRVPLSDGSPFYRDILVKKHASGNPQSHAGEPDPNSSTLFVVHLDSFVSDEDLCRIFSDFGEILSIKTRAGMTEPSTNKPQTTDNSAARLPNNRVKMTRVTFASADALHRSLATAVNVTDGLSFVRRQSQTLKPILLEKCYASDWVRQVSPPDPADLHRDVEEYMAAYDERVFEEKKKRTEVTKQKDDQGFTLVTRDGAKTADGVAIRAVRSQSKSAQGIFARSTTNAISGLSRADLVSSGKKRKLRGGCEEDFYRFQLREKRREELAQMRRQDVDDEQTIASMKQARKFEVA